MKKIEDLSNLTVEQLVQQFADLGVAQYQAASQESIRLYNKLFAQTMKVTEELKSREGDARTALVALYRHPNVEVRMGAAKATLAVNPEGARDLLIAIEKLNRFPQSPSAGMCLSSLEDGTFKPT